MPDGAIPSPKTGTQLVDEHFIENRTRVLELAAFLDRLDRTGDGAATGDFRVRALREALGVLSGEPGEGTRILRVQMVFSDPTGEPREALDQKSARGAYDRWQEGV
ncbi:MAG: hypothetical protein M3P24_09250 [Gemmatimonadota bacterium]|nr:hypothetical protein [Gemmatimonadota bacterium]